MSAQIQHTTHSASVLCTEEQEQRLTRIADEASRKPWKSQTLRWSVYSNVMAFSRTRLHVFAYLNKQCTLINSPFKSSTCKHLGTRAAPVHIWEHYDSHLTGSLYASCHSASWCYNVPLVNGMYLAQHVKEDGTDPTGQPSPSVPMSISWRLQDPSDGGRVIFFLATCASLPFLLFLTRWGTFSCPSCITDPWVSVSCHCDVVCPFLDLGW